MSCHFPRAAFYIYFGAFLFGYIWLVGVLIHKYVSDGGTTEYGAVHPKSLVDLTKPILPAGDSNLGNPRLDSEIISENSELKADGGPLKPSDVVRLKYNWLRQKKMLSGFTHFTNDSLSKWCIETTKSDPLVPSFIVCLHNPDQDRTVSAHLHTFRSWEEDITRLLVKLLRYDNNAIFMDIGANIGYYTLLALKLEHKVIAVEPFADHVVRIQEAVVQNGFRTDDVVLLMAAVLDTRRVNVAFLSAPNNFGGRFVAPTDETRLMYRGSRVMRANSILMDDMVLFLKDFVKRNPDETTAIIKMDVQGSECRALSKSQRLFRRVKVLALIMEWSELSRQPSQWDKDCLSSLVQSLTNNYNMVAVDLYLKPLDDLLGTLGKPDGPSDVVWIGQDVLKALL